MNLLQALILGSMIDTPKNNRFWDWVTIFGSLLVVAGVTAWFLS